MTIRPLLRILALFTVLALSVTAFAQRVNTPSIRLNPAGSVSDSAWLPVGTSPVLGSASAPVTIVVFSDFQCPYCGRLFPVLRRLEKAYKGDVRIVYKHNPLPFHRQAFLSAQASVEAHRQGQFWQMAAELFANRRKQHRGDLEGYARSVGLDVVRLRDALNGATHTQTVRDDMALARKLGARGTPTSFINGRRLSGARPYASFEKVVKEELAAAQVLLDRGVDADDIYAEITKGREAQAMASARPRRYRPHLAGWRAPRRARPAKPVYYPISVGAGDPCRGPASAPVTIVGFADFQCPFSRRVVPTLRAVFAAYPSQVRYCFKHLPLAFHKRAKPAALAAIEAHAQGRFWDYHDLLFANQRALRDADLEKYASQLNLAMDQFRDALRFGQHQQALQRDMRLAKRASVRGTPNFFINGRALRGARPLSAFKKVIDEELKKVGALP